MDETLVPNIVDFISHIDPFDKLPKVALVEVAQSIQISYLAAKSEIQFDQKDQEQYLYLIRSGTVEQRHPNGTLRARLEQEDLFGFTHLADSAEHEPYQAITLTACLLYLIPVSKLNSILAQYPEQAQHFATAAQTRLESALNVVWSDAEKGLFVETVADVAQRHPAIVDSKMSIKEVARIMRYQHHSSCAVIIENQQIIGIITDRDMTKRVIADGVSTDAPITQVMTRHPYTIGSQDLVLKAVSLMMEHNIRSLPVVDNQQVVGLLTTSDLVRKHRVQAIFLIEKINHAQTVEALAQLTAERQAIYEALVEGHVQPAVIGQVMAMIMDAINRRLITFAEQKLGPPPCPYAWVVAGSHARNEVHILSDQDSAIIFSDHSQPQDKTYFNYLAMFVCNGLAACGYPLCTGRFMAAKPQWCQPMRIWREYYRKWVASPEYDKLLNVSVFFEIRTVYGEDDFAQQLRQELYNHIDEHPQFLSSLVRNALTVKPPLGIFNNLVLEHNGSNSKSLNIKKYAINIMVDLARVYALAAQSDAMTTEQRFIDAHQHAIINKNTLDDLLGAYRFMLQLRQHHQWQALKQGNTPDNYIDPNQFGSFERKHLKDAFRIVANLQEICKMRFIRR
ncbi:TPA: DUF294 nucleotidyltransferase-like domain-containing protein [Photobacterium damselae]